MGGPWRGAAQPLELVANRGWPNLEGVSTDAIPTITIMVAVNTRSCNPASNAYVLSDRGTWLFFKNKGDLVIVVEGDPRLFSQYGVMLVSPQKHPNVKKELGQQFIDWLVLAEGQKAIADYKINGDQLFYPNANDPGA